MRLVVGNFCISALYCDETFLGVALCLASIAYTSTQHKSSISNNVFAVWAVVVAQLVERLLSTPEICGLSPDISKMLSTNCRIEKTKIKKKRLGMAHL